MLQYAVWTSNNKWLLIVDGEFLFLSCQHPGNYGPKDHLDSQKNFQMDCVIPYQWIFQKAWAQRRLINKLSGNAFGTVTRIKLK